MINTDSCRTWARSLRPHSTLVSALAVTAIPSIFAVSIFTARSILTHRFGYSFLVWNLFLAWVPLGLAVIAAVMQRVHGAKPWQILPVLGLWLIFLPNAPYILTDVIHLFRPGGFGFWYDLALVLSFALAGLMAGVASLRIVQQIVASMVGPRLGAFAGYSVVVGCAMLCGVGMYLGRVLRWNSWDPLIHPSLLWQLARAVANPWDNRHAAAFAILFGVLFAVVFVVFTSAGRRQTASAPGSSTV